MAWELLPVNYTDAIWNGLKKYNQINNADGTVSLQDVTEYTNKENSFFGALQANRMNEALNAIMSMVENGTDLYEAFQIYFSTQKELFEEKTAIEMDAYKANQKLLFEMWFESIKGKLAEDLAGNLQNQIDDMNLEVKGFVSRTTTFSEDRKTITEVAGSSKREVIFNDDDTITEKLYENDILVLTKLIKFTDNDLVIKEEIL